MPSRSCHVPHPPRRRTCPRPGHAGRLRRGRRRRQDIDKVNGSITAEAGQTYGDLETVNGSIHVEANAPRRRRRDRQRQHPCRRRRAGRRPATRSTAASASASSVADRQGRGNRQRRASSSTAAATSAATSAPSTARSAWSTPTSAAASRPSTATSPSASARTCKGGIQVEKPNSNWSIHFGKRKHPAHRDRPERAWSTARWCSSAKSSCTCIASARTGTITGATAIRFDGAHAPQD